MIYLHVPFCRSFCTYCDFYSEVAARCQSLFENYSDAVVAEIKTRRKEICDSDGINTLYIGGGTPSVLPLCAYERIIAALKELGVNTDFEEFTFEVNPEDIVEGGEAYVEGLLKLGVDRVSMGVQSFDDDVLRFMNRRHSSADAVKAYGILENAGVKNISIDLIFGLPQLTARGWDETLKRALDISSHGILPRHISAYQLSVEPGSMLAKLVERGKWTEASDEQCEIQYEALCAALATAGYHHYEISNFAQPGYEAIHNSAYWSHIPYVGLGPGAHSYIGDVRSWNRDSLKEYVDAGQTGDFSAVQDGESLEEDQLVMEKIMLGLRTSKGVEESYMKEHCDRIAFDEALCCGNLIRLATGNIRIPENRFFISDSIIANIL